MHTLYLQRGLLRRDMSNLRSVHLRHDRPSSHPHWGVGSVEVFVVPAKGSGGACRCVRMCVPLRVLYVVCCVLCCVCVCAHSKGVQRSMGAQPAKPCQVGPPQQ